MKEVMPMSHSERMGITAGKVRQDNFVVMPF